MSKRKCFSAHRQSVIGDHAVCVRCGADSEKTYGDELSKPYAINEHEVYCPDCRTYTDPNTYDPTPEEEARRRSREIEQAFHDNSHLTIKFGGGSSNGNSRGKKLKIVTTIRHEQDMPQFQNGNTDGAIITRLEVSSELLQVIMPEVVKEGLESAARGRRIPSSVVMREAVSATLGRCSGIVWDPEMKKKKKNLYLTPGESSMLRKTAAEMTETFKVNGVRPSRVTPSQLVSECVSSYLGFEVIAANVEVDPF